MPDVEINSMEYLEEEEWNRILFHELNDPILSSTAKYEQETFNNGYQAYLDLYRAGNLFREWPTLVRKGFHLYAKRFGPDPYAEIK